jgi:hypothetical protein
VREDEVAGSVHFTLAASQGGAISGNFSGARGLLTMFLSTPEPKRDAERGPSLTRPTGQETTRL